MAVPHQSFFGNFLGRLHHSCCPSNHLMCSFLILSLLVTPHIHLSILISFTSSRASCPLVVAQVSAPYNIAGLTTFVNLCLQFHWHPPATQHSTASLPVSQSFGSTPKIGLCSCTTYKKKGKGNFYIAQLDRSKRFTLFASPGRPVHSDTNSASPGSILARQQLRAKAKSLTHMVSVGTNKASINIQRTAPG